MKAKTDIPKMPAYTRTRHVEAARITGWAQGKGPCYLLSLDAGATIEVTPSFMQINDVKIGSYLVNSGGKLSCITAERFAEHYRAVWVEPKRQVDILRHAVPCEPLEKAQARLMDNLFLSDMIRA